MGSRCIAGHRTVMGSGVTAVSGNNGCYFLAGAQMSPVLGGGFVIDPSGNTDPVSKHFDIINNINYYIGNPLGVGHRDSLYYWVGQLQTPYGTLSMADLLIQDSLLDSAYTVYTRYRLPIP